MLALGSLLALATLVSWSCASPVASDLDVHSRAPGFSIGQLLCNLPLVPRALCPRHRQGGTSVRTPLGLATGVQHGPGVRFAVKYASAARWQESTAATTWQLPNGSTDPAALPLMCAQSGVDPSAITEDCLSALIYVPPSVSSGSNVPTFMWIHGGSYNSGSATNPGLDGINLAVATNSIVVVVQYRLAALGFMPPSSNTNLAVKDMIACMKFLRTVLPSFGGDASKITLAGQSSGADMVRALLAVPSASSLFQSAILQSDPIDYGFLTNTVQAKFQAAFNSYLDCSSTDTACLQALPIQTVLDASDQLASTAGSIDVSASPEEQMRPVRDGTLITASLDDQTPFPSVSKPLLLTNVKDEAAPTIYFLVPDFMTTTFYNQWIDGFYGQPKADMILNSSFYTVPVLADGQAQDARVPLTVLGSDSIWRCPTWTFARAWTAHGGQAHVALFTLGARYPFNAGIAQCQQPGVVCHQDDIEIVFGTVPAPTQQQRALTAEVQARYKAFMYSGNPNAPGLPTWNAAGTSDVPALLLGQPGLAAVGACDPSFWGAAVPYDYQIWED